MAYDKEFQRAIALNRNTVVITEATLSLVVDGNLKAMTQDGEKYGFVLQNVALNPHYAGFDFGTQIVATFRREQATIPQKEEIEPSLAESEKNLEEMKGIQKELDKIRVETDKLGDEVISLHKAGKEKEANELGKRYWELMSKYNELGNKFLELSYKK